jgi:hypothetical protein
MYKAGFVSFGEVNTPIDVVCNKSMEARDLLLENGFELVEADVVTDDEKGIDAEKAIRSL